MYLDTFVMAVGFFMLVPLLGVYFIQELQWSAAMAGIVLAISGLSLQGFKFICGIIADRMGYKRAIMLGIGIRIIGFMLYGVVQDPIGIGAAAFISGLGGAMFHPASYAAYAKLADLENKEKIFTKRELISNMGFIIGPMIGMFLLKLDFSIVCISSAMMFLIAFLLTWGFLPNMEGEKAGQPWQMVRRVANDKIFLKFNLFLIGVWSLSNQLYLAVPVRAGQVFENSSIVAYIYTAGALSMVAMQMPVLRLIRLIASPIHTMAAGIAVIGTGLLLIGAAKGITGFIGAVIVFTLGQMLTIPTMNRLTSDYAVQGYFASYFGFNGLALALGGFFGNYIGGKLHDAVFINEQLRWLPWGSQCLFGLLLAIGLFLSANRLNPKKTQGE